MESPNCDVEQIHLTKKMKAKLLCKDENFEILALNSEAQVVLDDDKTIWNWNVKPVKYGMGVLELILSVAIAVEGIGYEMKDLETYRKDINIKVNAIYSTKQFFIVNWQWIIGLICGSGLLFSILKQVGVFK
jgi:hypothetical protein